MDKCYKVAGLYVASLQAMAIIHTRNHWLSKGDSFYSKHLLFQRIYESALEDLDKAAEKFIGIFGSECLDFSMQTEFISKALAKYKNLEGDPLAQSLAFERDFVKFSKDAYDCFEQEDKMSLGLDDMIMAIASNREESVYLLQQNISKASD